MLEQDRLRISRLVGRRICDEQRVVAQVPGQFVVLLDTGQMLFLADASHLGRACLTRHFEAGIGNAPGIGRAAGFVGDGIHAGLHGRQRRIGKLQTLELRTLFHIVAHHAHDARHHLIAARHPGRQHAELDGSHQHITLADAGVERFPLLPRSVKGRFLPGAAGDHPCLLAGDFDMRQITETELVRAQLDRVDSNPPRHFVEEDVAGGRDPAVQVDMPMSAPFPAMEHVIAELKRAAAIDAEIRRQQSRIKRRQRHSRLERRARRIDTRQNLVDQRIVVIGHETFPLRGCDADIELVGIVAGCRRHRDHVARRHIHHHAGRTFIAKSLGHEFLHFVVDGEIDVGARHARIAAQFANDTAIGIHFHPARASRSAHL